MFHFLALVVNMILVLGQLLSRASTSAQTTVNQTTFSAKLFDIIAQENMKQNVIISPVFIQTALALAYMGAEGKTANELRAGLYLGSKNVSKEQVAHQFGDLMDKMRGSGKATFTMANRIYAQNGLQIAPKFNDVAGRYFASGAENVDFGEKKKTAEKINNWIKIQTENKIQSIISSGDLDYETVVILVNAIYFKARWITPFDSKRTTKKNFHLSKTSTKKIDMMSEVNIFGYAELTDLDAKALTLRYIGTNIQMLVLLPNKLDGLAQLERKLINVDLTKYSNKLQMQYVSVFLPKFKIEFDISLQPTLKMLGISELFIEKMANLSSLFTNVNNTYVRKVLHKAFIEVNETGTVAAASTVVKFKGPIIRGFPTFEFNADHPFYFAILDEDTVYFSGHFANIMKIK